MLTTTCIWSEYQQRSNGVLFDPSSTAALPQTELRLMKDLSLCEKPWNGNKWITYTWFPQPRKYYFPGYFQDLSRKKLPFSRTKKTRFKGTKSRRVKNYIIFIQCMIDCWHFYGTASASPLQGVWSNHFYLNFN